MLQNYNSWFYVNQTIVINHETRVINQYILRFKLYANISTYNKLL